MNKDRASTPSLICNTSRYLDENGKQYDIEQTREIEMMRNELYQLKIKSQFLLKMTNVDLKRIYPLVLEIVQLDDSRYMINKINAVVCHKEINRVLNQARTRGKQYILFCCNMSILNFF